MQANQELIKENQKICGSSCFSGKIFVALFFLVLLCAGLFAFQFWQADSASIDQYPLLFSGSECQVGSYVQLGRYPQNNGEIPELIDWLVLDNDGQTALLISKYGLDCLPFNHYYIASQWKDCDLRKWLNNNFFYQAFDNNERRQIEESLICTGDNRLYGTKGCGDTSDKLFCLSFEELEKYFSSDEERECRATKYTANHKVFLYNDLCCYWTRSPGVYGSLAGIVAGNGIVIMAGCDVNRVVCSVRPAMRIKLKPS